MQKLKDKIKQEPFIFLFRKMWQFTGGRKKKLILAITLLVLSNIVALIDPLILAALLNEVQSNGIGAHNIKYLLMVISLPFLTTLGYWLFHGIGRVMENENGYHFKEAYRTYLMRGVMDLPLSWHGDRDSGATIDKINNALNTIGWFSKSLFRMIKIIIKSLGVIIVLAFFDPWISLIAIVLAIMAFYILYQFDKRLTPQYKRLNKYWNAVSAKIFDSISNITSISILNVQNPIIKNIQELTHKPFSLTKKNILLNEYKWFTGSMLVNTLIVGSMALYIIGIYNNNTIIQVGTLSALYMYLTRLSSSFFEFSDIYGVLIMRKAQLENAEEIEKAIEANQKTQQKKQKIQDWSELKISNLNFSYHGKLGSRTTTSEKKQADLHLDDVTITLQKGERVAFIGESGSGKTTFLKVLHGLYETASANVTFSQEDVSTPEIDGKDKTLRGLAPQSFETNFTNIDLATMLVPQEPEIFSSTIKENITLGLPTKTKEIEKVINLARFSDVVAKLPKGLKSVINEKGVNLSGGQKQRLALARALLFAQDKQILLLDESTSSVDPENEAKIYEDIFKEYQDKTILASIHKMNLLKYFDRIVMFENGKIVDEGTFESLLKKNKKFKNEWEAFVKSNV